MAKKPNQKAAPARNASRTRHSKPAKKPVTIEHDPKDVKNSGAAKPQTARRSVPSSKPASDVTKASTDSPVAKTASKQPEAKNNTTGTAAKSTAAKAGDTKTSTGSTDAKQVSPGSSKSLPTSTGSPTRATSSSGGKKEGGWGSTLLAACIGGIVALGLAGLLQYAGILSTPGASTADTEATTQLESRIAGLEEKLTAQPTAETTNETVTKLVDQRLASQSASANERIAAVESGVAQLRDQFGSLPAGTSMDAATVARINELVEDVATLKSATPASNAATTADSGASSAQLDEIAAAAEQIRTDLTAQIESMSAKLEKTNVEQAETNAALAETNTKLEETLTKTSQTNTEITTLRDRVENGADKRAAAAIAAAALKSDIDSGVPFDESLSNLRAFSPGISELESLDSFAQKGVPTVAQLTAEFENSVSAAILAATAPVEDGSLASRLAAGARSLVEVKPIGEIDGESPQARISQIQTALKNSNLSKASDTWNALPETGREASTDWHSRLQARLTANTVVTGTIESVLNSNRGG